MKELLEFEIYEDLEPYDWDFHNQGLYVFPGKKQKFKKNCIDHALKKLFGKDWKAPGWVNKKKGQL